MDQTDSSSIQKRGSKKGIYGHGKNVRKSKGYLRISLVPGVHPTLGTMDDKEHGKLRRLLNQGLSDSHFRTIDSEISRLALLFASNLGKTQDTFDSSLKPGEGQWSAPKNLAEWSDFFTFDVMSQLVFGTSYHLLTDPTNHWIIDGVLGQMRRISFLTTLPELQDMRFHHILFPEARKKAISFSGKSREILEARRARDKTDTDGLKNDLFSKLLTAKDPETGESLSQAQLWAESNLLIIAGSDTSSTESPEKSVKHSPPTKTYRKDRSSHHAPIFAHVSQEALRLNPAASGAMWREALPGGLDIASENLHIPAGCEVGTGIFSLNHNKAYFPEPFVYKPERWIASESGEDSVAKAKAAFATFSVGPRNCVGKNLAMIEISLAAAAVIRQYDFRQAESSLGQVGDGTGTQKGVYQTLWAFTSLKQGPYIQFKPVPSIGA
ncbi:benzoate 4-monooxygenase cytochrome P450 [Pyrenophora tritici-repentis Pt-1C-BFP]|uniref:Benzoate 4-monooxygenase cytochrome P450 n=1 Tax=Pyrenophora tritici-repentis (strain Pt-1C-BFP) TaxID=426418 RepID=B2WPW1_PYRTR|nr:benzoate 4-monooxygenase cytochrome P450 [Pyrenophora tritici-repentis Pt-1C-BFP]EDU46177.1 benzoate 4-monooxygenase cytochrome P450 [Pyrenophora tritici-repentis Pt-1C-BFP]